MQCKFCRSEKIVKDGQRKLSQSLNQKYLCVNCGKRFSAKKGKFDRAVVLFAISTYNSGMSLARTAALITRTFRTSVDPATISRWVRKYGNSFRAVRDQLLKNYKGKEIVATRPFVHFGLVYPFMLHRPKVDELCINYGLKDYLLGLGPWADRYFSSGIRCSQLKTVSNVEIEEKKNYLCSAVGFILGACTDLKERHALVQKYLLYNDTNTIATEVPVWAYDKKLGAICGHIDVLQIKADRVRIADYKPGTRCQDKGKVVSQLYWYARALSFRAKIPLEKINCCYFDEEICMEFEPSRVKLDLKDDSAAAISRNAKENQPLCNTPSAGKALQASVAFAMGKKEK